MLKILLLLKTKQINFSVVESFSVSMARWWESERELGTRPQTGPQMRIKDKKIFVNRIHLCAFAIIKFPKLSSSSWSPTERMRGEQLNARDPRRWWVIKIALDM